jgi:hypothetical protein
MKETLLMPLDLSRPKPLTTTLHYLKRGAEKPTRYVDDPPPGAPAWNGIDDPREIGIEDARGREDQFTLDRNGFQLVKSASNVHDFYSPEEVERTYYPEVERLLRTAIEPVGGDGVAFARLFDETVKAFADIATERQIVAGD